MATYSAKVVFPNTSTPQLLTVQASSAAEAKQVINSMYGPIKRCAQFPARSREPALHTRT